MKERAVLVLFAVPSAQALSRLVEERMELGLLPAMRVWTREFHAATVNILLHIFIDIPILTGSGGIGELMRTTPIVLIVVRIDTVALIVALEVIWAPFGLEVEDVEVVVVNIFVDQVYLNFRLIVCE